MLRRLQIAHHQHTHGPINVNVEETVHEHRAPTDESVKLLREMEGTAQQRVLQSGRTLVNDVNVVWHIHQDHEHLGREAKIHARININGKEYIAEIELPDAYLPEEKWLQSLAAACAKAIFLSAFEPLARNLSEHHRNLLPYSVRRARG